MPADKGSRANALEISQMLAMESLEDPLIIPDLP